MRKQRGESKERKKKVSKGNNGITLIALVITIIVLLILAGVTIATLTGDNRILTKASQAKEEMTQASAEEKVNVEVLGSYGNDGNINMDMLNENLQKVESLTYNGEKLSGDNVISKLPAIVNVDGYDVLISGPADAAAVKENASMYYGAEVTGYECASDGVNKWRIFYSDGNNIYLIADDYIHYDDTPATNQGQQLDQYGDYRYSFGNVYKDYRGSNSINDKVKIWLSKYLSYGSNATNTQGSINGVAYMLDIDIWNNYAGEDAEYAIGGPTIEMYCESYKDTHPDKYIENNVVTNGYNIKWNTDTEYTTSLELPEEDYNSIYVKSGKANGMWIASPSADGLVYLMCTDQDYVTSIYGYNSYYGNIWGLRPIVCLNSDVILENGSGDNYIIK